MAAGGNLLQRGVLEYGMCRLCSVRVWGCLCATLGWSARQDIWERTGVRWVVWWKRRWAQAEWLFRRYGCDFVFFSASAAGRLYPHCKVDIMLMRISDSSSLSLSLTLSATPPATPCSLISRLGHQQRRHCDNIPEIIFSYPCTMWTTGRTDRERAFVLLLLLS